jgi:hypothetical protein
VTESGFPDALVEAIEALEQLRRERQQLDIRIAKMEQVVAALRSVSERDEDVAATTGFTDAVRSVLKGASERGVSPTEIREGMLALGLELSRYSQPLATIHVVLKRLQRNGEVIEVDHDPKRYWWALYGVPPAPSDGPNEGPQGNGNTSQERTRKGHRR